MARRLSAILSIVLLTIAAGALTATASGPQPLSPQPPQVAKDAAPEATCPPDGQCFADVSPGNPFYSFINRIFQQDLVTGYACGGVGEPCDPQGRPYYRPGNNVTRQQMAKLIDNARRLPTIAISSSGGTIPILAVNNDSYAIEGNSANGEAVVGISTIGYGIWGVSYSGTGVRGESNTGPAVAGVSSSGDGLVGNSDIGNGVSGISGGLGTAGVYGQAIGNQGYGVHGYASTSYAGVFGESGALNGGTGVIGVANGVDSRGVWGRSDTGLAGYFQGNVQVTGNLSKGAGSFKIDDPIDPSNKYLYHSFVESPDMMDIYNGNVTTDANGDATVKMPEWFDALNRDFRYQLTPIGQFAQAMVSQELTGGEFKIKTDKPNVKVSWQLTGIRQDPYANAHRIPVEEDKPANEKGKYLYPTEYGQPESKGVNYERDQQMKQPPAPR